MTKTQLISALATKLTAPKTQVKVVLEALYEVAAETLRSGSEFVLPKLVKFKVVEVGPKAERKARNPSTGKEMIVPAKPASKKLKARFLKPIKVDIGQLAASPAKPKAAKAAKAPKAAAAKAPKAAAKKKTA